MATKKRPQPLPEPQTASDAVLLAQASHRQTMDRISQAIKMLEEADSVVQSYARLTQSDLSCAEQRMRFILQRLESRQA